MKCVGVERPVFIRDLAEQRAASSAAEEAASTDGELQEPRKVPRKGPIRATEVKDEVLIRQNSSEDICNS